MLLYMCNSIKGVILMTNISNQVLEMQASPIRKLSPLANKAKKSNEHNKAWT